MSMSLLSWGAHHWTQHSRCVSAAEQWGSCCSALRNAAQETGGAFAMRAHCWLMDNLVSSRTPRAFSFQLVSPAVWAYSSPGEDLEFPCVELQ